MKIALLLLGLLFLSGCGRHYDMVLTNGMRVTGVSRPKLDKATEQYLYTDAAGNKRAISAGRVIEIQPHSDGPYNPLK